MRYVVELALLVMLAVPVGLIVYKGYKENWAQFAGLFGISVASAFLLDAAHGAGYIPAEMGLLAISVALLLLGTVIKVMRYNRPAAPPEPTERKT